jgi:hypothetical protein
MGAGCYVLTVAARAGLVCRVIPDNPDAASEDSMGICLALPDSGADAGDRY